MCKTKPILMHLFLMPEMGILNASLELNTVAPTHQTFSLRAETPHYVRNQAFFL